ncbi:YEATS domain-containing protein 4-like [Symsagittifera roscoffensis]|uniref:YEATS domain-containing protein 4-like n=1 Tax=Symsagittifera roscoffensis TaxID=84072 RepID=UPI00307BEA0E
MASEPKAAKMSNLVIKPVVFGSVSRYLGKKREEDGHTHSWTVYIKPYMNEDLSVFVKRVEFKLHDSYVNPRRMVNRPPYEITETGWGEFEIQIKLTFIDPQEKPVTFYHLLKLFFPAPDLIQGKKPLVWEHYDEMLFLEPSAMMVDALRTAKALSLGIHKHDTDFEAVKHQTHEDMMSTRRKVAEETERLRDTLKVKQAKLEQLKEELNKYEVVT